MIRFNLSSFSLSSLVFFFLFLLENENKENKLISISTLSMKEKNWEKCFWIRIFCSFSKKLEILSSPASVLQFFLESGRRRKNKDPLSFYFSSYFLLARGRKKNNCILPFFSFSISNPLSFSPSFLFRSHSLAESKRGMKFWWDFFLFLFFVLLFLFPFFLKTRFV